jgi:hypothetical protein
MADTHAAHRGRRTLADRYQDWTARNQTRMAQHPARAVLSIGGFTLIYLALIVLQAKQMHRINLFGVLFIVSYPVLMAAIVMRARTTLRRRHAEAARLPSPDGWRFAAVAFGCLAVLGVFGAAVAAMRGQPALIGPAAWVALMAVMLTVQTGRVARFITSPSRRLPDRIADRVAGFPQLSPGAFLPGNHRITLRLRDGREVRRVFVMYDHIVTRAGRRWRIDFSVKDAVDAENEVKAPARIGR